MDLFHLYISLMIEEKSVISKLHFARQSDIWLVFANLINIISFHTSNSFFIYFKFLNILI